MESNDKLKEAYIKNCICYYFDDIIKIEDFDLDQIIMDEKSDENILVYNISYKSLIYPQPSFIICKGKIWFHLQQYLVSVKSGIKYTIFTIMQKSK